MPLTLPPMPRSRLIIIGVALLVVVILALVFTGVIPGLRRSGGPASKPLTFWGVFDDPQTVAEVIAATGYPVTYRRFDIADYESALINALAAGTGPDLFMIHSSWLPKYVDKITPAPASVVSAAVVRELYPTVVEQDFAPETNVYALPLYLDTLALLYNRDLFDSNGIALPPATWADFEKLIPALRRLDAGGKLELAAAAIGGARNVNRAPDLLSVLMLQAGTQMVTSDFSRAAFADAQGESALAFYTSFANPVSPSYTWSDNFVNSLDGFAEGKVAMIFNYAYQIPTLLTKNPLLRIGVAPLPQPEQATLEVNYANYWGIAVSNRSKDLSGAWRFAASLAVTESTAQRYANRTGRLPALRTLLDRMLADGKWGVFATQALSARSWPQVDNAAVEAAFSKAITDVTGGQATVKRALDEAQATISELMRQRAANRPKAAPKTPPKP